MNFGSEGKKAHALHSTNAFKKSVSDELPFQKKNVEPNNNTSYSSSTSQEDTHDNPPYTPLYKILESKRRLSPTDIGSHQMMDEVYTEYPELSPSFPIYENINYHDYSSTKVSKSRLNDAILNSSQKFSPSQSRNYSLNRNNDDLKTSIVDMTQYIGKGFTHYQPHKLSNQFPESVEMVNDSRTLTDSESLFFSNSDFEIGSFRPTDGRGYGHLDVTPPVVEDSILNVKHFSSENPRQASAHLDRSNLKYYEASVKEVTPLSIEYKKNYWSLPEEKSSYLDVNNYSEEKSFEQNLPNHKWLYDTESNSFSRVLCDSCEKPFDFYESSEGIFHADIGLRSFDTDDFFSSIKNEFLKDKEDEETLSDNVYTTSLSDFLTKYPSFKEPNIPQLKLSYMSFKDTLSFKKEITNNSQKDFLNKSNIQPSIVKNKVQSLTPLKEMEENYTESCTVTSILSSSSHSIHDDDVLETGEEPRNFDKSKYRNYNFLYSSEQKKNNKLLEQHISPKINKKTYSCEQILEVESHSKPNFSSHGNKKVSINRGLDYLTSRQGKRESSKLSQLSEPLNNLKDSSLTDLLRIASNLKYEEEILRKQLVSQIKPPDSRLNITKKINDSNVLISSHLVPKSHLIVSDNIPKIHSHIANHVHPLIYDEIDVDHALESAHSSLNQEPEEKLIRVKTSKSLKDLNAIREVPINLEGSVAIQKAIASSQVGPENQRLQGTPDSTFKPEYFNKNEFQYLGDELRSLKIPTGSENTDQTYFVYAKDSKPVSVQECNDVDLFMEYNSSTSPLQSFNLPQKIPIRDKHPCQIEGEPLQTSEIKIIEPKIKSEKEDLYSSIYFPLESELAPKNVDAIENPYSIMMENTAAEYLTHVISDRKEDVAKPFLNYPSSFQLGYGFMQEPVCPHAAPCFWRTPVFDRTCKCRMTPLDQPIPAHVDFQTDMGAKDTNHFITCRCFATPTKIKENLTLNPELDSKSLFKEDFEDFGLECQCVSTDSDEKDYYQQLAKLLEKYLSCECIITEDEGGFRPPTPNNTREDRCEATKHFKCHCIASEDNISTDQTSSSLKIVCKCSEKKVKPEQIDEQKYHCFLRLPIKGECDEVTKSNKSNEKMKTYPIKEKDKSISNQGISKQASFKTKITFPDSNDYSSSQVTQSAPPTEEEIMIYSKSGRNNANIIPSVRYKKTSPVANKEASLSSPSQENIKPVRLVSKNLLKPSKDDNVKIDKRRLSKSEYIHFLNSEVQQKNALEIKPSKDRQELVPHKRASIGFEEPKPASLNMKSPLCKPFYSRNASKSICADETQEDIYERESLPSKYRQRSFLDENSTVGFEKLKVDFKSSLNKSNKTRDVSKTLQGRYLECVCQDVEQDDGQKAQRDENVIIEFKEPKDDSLIMQASLCKPFDPRGASKTLPDEYLGAFLDEKQDDACKPPGGKYRQKLLMDENSTVELEEPKDNDSISKLKSYYSKDASKPMPCGCLEYAHSDERLKFPDENFPRRDRKKSMSDKSPVIGLDECLKDTTSVGKQTPSMEKMSNKDRKKSFLEKSALIGLNECRKVDSQEKSKGFSDKNQEDINKKQKCAEEDVRTPILKGEGHDGRTKIENQIDSEQEDKKSEMALEAEGCMAKENYAKPKPILTPLLTQEYPHEPQVIVTAPIIMSDNDTPVADKCCYIKECDTLKNEQNLKNAHNIKSISHKVTKYVHVWEMPYQNCIKSQFLNFPVSACCCLPSSYPCKVFTPIMDNPSKLYYSNCGYPFSDSKMMLSNPTIQNTKFQPNFPITSQSEVGSVDFSQLQIQTGSISNLSQNINGCLQSVICSKNQYMTKMIMAQKRADCSIQHPPNCTYPSYYIPQVCTLSRNAIPQANLSIKSKSKIYPKRRARLFRKNAQRGFND